MTKPSHSQSDLERQCHLSGQMSAAQSVQHFGKAAPPAAPPDEWLNEAMRLADDHALWYSQTRDEPHAGRRAKLLAHLAAHPSAAPQGAQPAVTVFEVANKTSSALFASREDAQTFIGSFSAATGGGLYVVERHVFGAASPADAAPACKRCEALEMVCRQAQAAGATEPHRPDGSTLAINLAIDALENEPPEGRDWPVNWKVVVYGLKLARTRLAADAAPVPQALSLTDELIDAHLGLAYDSSGLNGMTGQQWDRIVARRFFSLGAAIALGVIPHPETKDAPVPQEVIELVRLTRDALTQCQANMAIGNAWHVASDAIIQADQFLSVVAELAGLTIPAKEQTNG